MCKVSDQLKLCTCHGVGEEPKTHYWVLYQKGGGGEAVGEVMFPPQFLPEIQEHNLALLERLLNQGNCFDFDIKLEENDRLELHLHVDPEQEKKLIFMGTSTIPEFVDYKFRYRQGEWVDAEWNPFHNDLIEKMQGKIVDAFGKDDS